MLGGEQAPSPLQTQLADAIFDALDAIPEPRWGYDSGAHGSGWAAAMRAAAEALVPLVERLISEAERRVLTQANSPDDVGPMI